MTSLGDEIRLLIFVAVQSFVLFACWRFVSRFVASRLQRLIDTLLLTYLIQYIAVGLPGMAGMLSPVSMMGMAALLSLGLLRLSRAKDEGGGMKDEKGEGVLIHPLSFVLPPSPLIVLAGLLFVVGYVAATVWELRYFPVMATDSLTYHLPAAVQWLQHGRIDLFQTWFFNPANTYSPLAGSILHAWLLGPIGNDTLAHFAAAPMVVLLFLAVTAIARSLGASTVTAVLVGVGLAMSHPIVSHIDKGKDDLFLAAFFAVAVGGFSQRRLRDPLGLWRVGVALGLCLAVKYTALLAMPMLLLAIDAPIRARWKILDYAAAIACVAALAGPWYLRNFALTGNPLFPADFLWFRGLFSTARSFELGTGRGLLGVLLSGTFAIPGLLVVASSLLWMASMTTSFRRLATEPLVRFVLLGPIVGVGLLIAISPYPEIRFILPSLVLGVASIGAIRGKWSSIVAGIFALCAIGTGLSAGLWTLQLGFCLGGLLAAVIGVGGVFLQSRFLRLRRDTWLIITGVIGLVLAGYAFIYWTAFLDDRRDVSLTAGTPDGRRGVWRFVRDELPRGELLAYTGTFTVYPLMGFDLDRPVAYAPVRAELNTLADLPRLGDHLTGEQIDPLAIAVTVARADQKAWLSNLHATGAKHLVVFFDDVKPQPIEKSWTDAMPERFKVEYRDNAGAVYRVIEP